MALTAKQQRFVQEYLVDLNATQAAIRAGYSEKNAGKIGPELIGKTRISAAIQQAQEAREQRTGITQDMVIEELRKVGFADAADYADAALKYSNKLRALELLGKHLGMFESRGPAPAQENNLLEVILDMGEIDTDDLPEVE